MTTYKQDLKELNITAEKYDNIISHIYDKTPEEMAVLAKVIKSGARVLPAVKRAFEHVLAIRQPERIEAYNIYYSIKEKKMIEKVEIHKLNFPVANIYNYNAMVFRSVDGGKTFFYCGYGKYFATIEEAQDYKKEIERRGK